MLVYGAIIAIYMMYVDDSKCGIPVTAWLLVHISLFMANSVARFLMIVIVRHFDQYRVYYNIVSTMFINCLIVGWLIYGNILYFSNENDCLEKPETQSQAYLMLFFLIVGYFQMGFTLLLLFLIPFVIWILIHHQP